MLGDRIMGALHAFFRTERVWNSPLAVNVEPTTGCGLSCAMCFCKKDQAASRFMEERVFQLIIKKLKPDVVEFSGAGEPFQHPDLAEFIKYADNFSVDSIVQTNLNCGAGPLAAALDAGLAGLKVSVDSADPGRYALIRRKGSLDQVAANLDFIRSRPGPKPRLSLESVLINQNMGDCGGIVDFAHRHGVASVNFHAIQTVGMNEETRKELIDDFNFPGLRLSLAAALARAQDLGVQTNIQKLLDDFNTIVDIYNRNENISRSASCTLPWMHLFVAVDGNVSPCFSLHCHTGVASGNILENSRDQILNGPAIACIRRGFRNKRVAKVCKECNPPQLSSIFFRKD
ncbi:MAG: hypothetical protein A2268_08450 [Candidatus Raymondbacteria bacterium RifOxyA12_full_50_37]|uniref:Radical SAM core domain-containing protein n=1 Tax=Candidatus Raymondbacteria bacterium RIFOXYD12_FULL_49_13 TaxID=1817890 RepID=A0A1F7F414_UNCRA|nr:MAG: hypothetical protein A2268_08450 [Candidatus Raymondbacteria bacterium RifOxyA12_full_50_37]OGJ90363.1 MAG: hypothetical protein A2248_17385 [Candidatus Raymondbacteria bacterium RIFOXYA2_FULL_49_16]OGK01302.1 MAG: hypothetical protein A2519_12930 [Candidatus Raymondbacteria bacterium RIFOXYD12_FULL_49_13]OGK04445.1 MAG: hypothetical protein A2487_14630 [Candidatus Raymondbacteria bacterium RifOxyC12_full_50_8]OGP43262.1 MAG: hypothetical protein A2324_08215 [Candidatus Raymondbacteria 